MYTYTHTDRQTDRQAGRQAGRQTDRQTYLPTYIHTYIYIYIDHPCWFMDAYHLLHVSWFIESRFDGDPWGGRGASSSRRRASLCNRRESLCHRWIPRPVGGDPSPMVGDPDPYTQWFCWSLSLLNGYNWGYTPFSDIPIRFTTGH